MSFTWQDKFTRIAERLPDDMLASLMRAVMAYGTDGEEPELEFPLDAIFEGFRADIDFSKDARRRGGRGGRSKARQPADDAQPLESGNDACGECENPLESGNEHVRESAEPLASGKRDCAKSAEPLASNNKTVQNSTGQNSTEQDKGEVAKRKRFAPPAPDEVAAYAAEIGLPESEAERFRDHYEANGWKVGGRTKMSDWRAALRNWKRNAARFGDVDGKVELHEPDEYSLIR